MKNGSTRSRRRRKNVFSPSIIAFILLIVICLLQIHPVKAAFLPTRNAMKNGFSAVRATKGEVVPTEAVGDATTWGNSDCRQYDISLLFSPLIGGPNILPIHCSVLLEDASNDKIVWADFLPETPTDSDTIRRLATFQTVPGLVRYKCSNRQRGTDDIFKVRSSIQLWLPFSSSVSLASLQSFCVGYQERYGGLNLLTNNCYHFCAAIVLQLLIRQDDTK